MLQKSNLNLIRKIFKSLPEVGAAACRRSPATFCSRRHHALHLCQMNVQLLGREEGRKESREDIEKRRGGSSQWVFCTKQVLHRNPRCSRVYIDPVCCAVPHHSTNQKILINFEKTLIDGVMSSDHIR